MAKILLAEDDDSLRGFLVNALKRAGHVVKDFDEGRTALKALEREVFDLLLTDIVMPGLDGIELARRGAELDPAMKIVFITGFAGVALSAGGPAPAGAKVLSNPSICASWWMRWNASWRPEGGGLSAVFRVRLAGIDAKAAWGIRRASPERACSEAGPGG